MNQRRDVTLQPFRKMGLFEIYTLASMISKMGNQVFYIAVPLFLYQQTHSSLVMGGGWIFQSLPYLLTPWIGRVIDRFDHRKVFGISEFSQALLVALIPLLSSFMKSTHLVLIFTLIFLIQVGSIISNIIGDYSFLPELSRSEDKNGWNSAYVTLTNIGRMMGPGVAGVMVGAFSYLSTLYLDSASFLFTSGFALFILKSKPTGKKKPRVSMRGGFQILRQTPSMLRVVISFSLVNLACGGLTVLILFFMQSTWKMQNSEVGLVMSTASACGLLGAFIAVRSFKTWGLLKRLQFWSMCLLIVLLPLAFLNQAGSIVGFVLSEGCMTVLNVLFMTYRQQTISTEFMGRANALIRMILFSMVPVSTVLLTGVAATSRPYWSGILIFVCLVVAWGCLLPNIKMRYGSNESQQVNTSKGENGVTPQ